MLDAVACDTRSADAMRLEGHWPLFLPVCPALPALPPHLAFCCLSTRKEPSFLPRMGGRQSARVHRHTHTHNNTHATYTQDVRQAECTHTPTHTDTHTQPHTQCLPSSQEQKGVCNGQGGSSSLSPAGRRAVSLEREFNKVLGEECSGVYSAEPGSFTACGLSYHYSLCLERKFSSFNLFAGATNCT